MRSTRRSRELFAELGTLVVLDDALVDVAMGLMSCAPAYVALVAEAQIDAGVRRGIPAAQGAELVVQTLAGTAELLRRRGNDTMAVRREVASPGGLTARASTRSSAAACAPPSATRSTPCSWRRLMMLASARTEIADFLSTVIYVYTLLIILHIVIQLLFAPGCARPTRARATPCWASCATSANRSCASSAASCRSSAASTSARSSRS